MIRLTPDSLTEWFHHRLGHLGAGVTEVAVTSARRASRGVSRETWLIDGSVVVDGERRDAGWTVRRDHDVGSVDPVPLRTEFEVYRRLDPSPVPVASPLWFEDDPAWQPDGREAYVRRQIAGHWYLPFLASSDPADDEARIEASKEQLRALAVVHTCDWEGLGFGDLFPVPDGPQDCARNLVRWFLARIDAIRIEPSPVVTEAASWLLANAPTDSPCVSLCKGTNGHGEEVWRDGHIVAMSDWELACLGDPAYDLAQCQELIPEIVRDGVRRWGLPEALAYYESVSGISVTVERVGYYKWFYGLPMFMFTHHAGGLVVHEGNRLARFAWTSTEMQHRSQLMLASAAGFGPGGDGR